MIQTKYWKWFVCFVSVAIGAMVWWAKAHEIDLQAAFEGFTPISWVYEYLVPENWTKNYPSGVEQYRNSAFLYVYLIAYKFLNIAPENLIHGVIAFEMFVLAIAVYCLSRVMLPKAPIEVSLLAVILVIASSARDMNVANFREPVFIGQFYNVANALRIFAIASFLRGKLPQCAALLALSCVCHATLGLMGGIFLFGMFLAAPRDYEAKRILRALVPFLLICVFWVGTTFRFHGPSGLVMPSELWFRLTHMASYHWYPVAMGFFTTEPDRFLIPFPSLLLLTAFALERKRPLSRIERQIIGGIFMLMALVVIGVLFSVVRVSPTMVKLAFHRSNDLIVLVSLVYATEALWSEIENGAWWKRLVAVLILFSPFFGGAGFPVILVFIFVFPALLSTNTHAVKALFVLCLGLLAYCLLRDSTNFWTSPIYLGGSSMLSILPYIFGVLIAFLVLKRIVKLDPTRVAVFLALPFAVNSWLKAHEMLSSPRLLAERFEEVQVWAKTHTAKDALFMTDPALTGWRDYSQRSSVGNLREWLYTAWGYTADLGLYQQGLQFFNEFGVDMQPYLQEGQSLIGYYKLSDVIRDRFYSFGDDWREPFAKKYGVEYFVMLKGKMSHPSSLPVAFQNSEFVVLDASKVRKENTKAEPQSSSNPK